MAKVYLVWHTVMYCDEYRMDHNFLEETLQYIEKVFGEEERAIRYIQDRIREKIEYYKGRIERVKYPYQKYECEWWIGKLNEELSDIHEHRQIMIGEDASGELLYHYTSHDVE